MKQEKKSDTIILVVCLVLITAFVVLLPNFNGMVRKHKEDQSADSSYPTTYHCVANFEEEEYTLNQDATYTLDGRKIIGVDYIREYTFVSFEEYTNWKEKNEKSSSVEGQTKKLSFDEENLKITVQLNQDILKMDEDDLGDYFPKNYDNLLIYTKDQKCDSK